MAVRVLSRKYYGGGAVTAAATKNVKRCTHRPHGNRLAGLLCVRCGLISDIKAARLGQARLLCYYADVENNSFVAFAFSVHCVRLLCLAVLTIDVAPTVATAQPSQSARWRPAVSLKQGERCRVSFNGNQPVSQTSGGESR